MLVMLVSIRITAGFVESHPKNAIKRLWSGQQDLNLRPAVPKTAALPGCAIPRRSRLVDTSFDHRPASRSARRAERPISGHCRRSSRRPGRPAVMPSLRAVPAITSSTARTGAAGGNQAVRQRLGVLCDAHDAAVAANEDHVERDVGVVHPERDRLVVLEVEQHAVAFRQLLAEHQAALALRVVDRELDREGVDAGLLTISSVSCPAACAGAGSQSASMTQAPTSKPAAQRNAGAPMRGAPRCRKSAR